MTIPDFSARAKFVARAVSALVFATFALGAAPAIAVPCAGFVDVDDADPFCAHVEWMKNRSITLGCTVNQYCPDSAVTRLQMAAFMHRLGNVTFQQGGNAYGATAVLGTTDDQPIDIRANGQRVMRYDPAPGNIPNLIGGAVSNNADPGHRGQTVGGGHAHSAASDFATIGGGFGNSVGGLTAWVGGGEGNTADGSFSAIAGGYRNQAIGKSSFVAGREGIAAEEGMFVWSDSRITGFEFNPALHRAPGDSVNTFNVRATGVGGVWLVTGIHPSTGVPTWGCYAQNGSGWTCTSDRDAKRNLEPIEGGEVLAKIAALPIYRWQPKDGPNANIMHVGPMAQDFHAAFGLGDSDKSIGFQDADGVAIAAIQGLDALAKRQAKAIDRQARAIDALRAELAEQRNALAESRPALARVIANDGASGEVPQARASETTSTRWNRKVTLRRLGLGAKP